MNKEQAQLAYELYSAYLGNDLGHPLESRDNLPETIRGAWRFTIKQLLALVPVKGAWTTNKDDMYPQEGVAEIVMSCQGCGDPLLLANRRIADGCPCNSPRGVNHGLVAKNTCTCIICDPARTGGTRIGLG